MSKQANIEKAVQVLKNAGFEDARQKGDFVISDQLCSESHGIATDTLYEAGLEDFEFETYSRIEFY